MTGTFARVWLARLPHPKDSTQDQVFALKVLRKVDGEMRLLNPHRNGAES
jgi:hypothetical protein